jgi:membrane-associated PAP2 superfamily phosphatase
LQEKQAMFVHALSRRLTFAHAFPCALVAFAVATASSTVDYQFSGLFFDESLRSFPLRDQWALELIGHHLGKSLVVLVWMALLCLALAAFRFQALRPWRALLLTTVVAMAAGPSIVVLLKSTTPFPCPWDSRQFGGFSPAATGWFVMPVNAGRCFPAGHSAGGFSLFAFFFAARAMHRPRMSRIALGVALALGTVFSGVRIAQGAHFLSHTLWAAAIDWTACGLIFLWFNPPSPAPER